MLMTALQWVNTAIVTVGIPATIGGLVFVGRKLETLDSLKVDIHENIKPDLKDVRERFAALEGKSAGLFQAHSPISLTDKGEQYLNESGLKKFVDNNKDVLTGACAENGSMDTPYDVQQSVFDFFDGYVFPEETENAVKTYAYKQGINVESMRRVAAIYFRDICLATQGFKAEDLDVPPATA